MEHGRRDFREVFIPEIRRSGTGHPAKGATREGPGQAVSRYDRAAVGVAPAPLGVDSARTGLSAWRFPRSSWRRDPPFPALGCADDTAGGATRRERDRP